MTNGQIHIGSMSHETAIGILKLMLEAMEVYDSISPTLERVNAVKMGIEALEQESNCLKIPTGSTTKDYLGVDYLGVDCISREQALRELKESAEHHANDSREKALLRRDRDIIRALPSVTPQPKTGHWKEEFNDLEGEVRFTCSSCGKYQLFGTDFCYHCGSDNREVEE